MLCSLITTSRNTWGGGLLYAASQGLGFVGVGAFFAISGYLFGRKYAGLSCDTSREKSGRWLLKRGARILIPYWIIFFIVVIVRLVNGLNVSSLNIIVGVLNLQGITQLAWAFDELGHTWFISILMVCYLLTPILWRLVKSRTATLVGVIVFVVAGATAALLGYQTSSSYISSVFMYCIMFYVGVHVTNNGIPQIKTSLLCLALCACLALRLLLNAAFDNTSIYYIALFVLGLFTSPIWVLIVYNVITKVRIPEKGSRVYGLIKWFDSVSYEVYLVHALFISASTSLYGLLGGGVPEMCVLFALTLVCAQVLHVVTKPMISKINSLCRG